MSMELAHKLTISDTSTISRPDASKYGGASIGDKYSWYRRCVICGKIYTILQLAANGNRTPCCKILTLA